MYVENPFSNNKVIKFTTNFVVLQKQRWIVVQTSQYIRTKLLLLSLKLLNYRIECVLSEFYLHFPLYSILLRKIVLLLKFYSLFYYVFVVFIKN